MHDSLVADWLVDVHAVQQNVSSTCSWLKQGAAVHLPDMRSAQKSIVDVHVQGRIV